MLAHEVVEYNVDNSGCTVIPFIGLANSSAPGLSHYLGFLRPMAKSDGPGSGIVQGVIPSIGIALVMWIFERGINREYSDRLRTDCADGNGESTIKWLDGAPGVSPRQRPSIALQRRLASLS